MEGDDVKTKQLSELIYQMLETERGGMQVYETALRCVVNDELREEWEKNLDQTSSHERIVLELMDKLGLDPERETPGRGVVRLIGESLVGAMEMARKEDSAEAAQLVACEAVVQAETKDHLNWELLHEASGKGEGRREEGPRRRLRAGRGAGGRASLPLHRLVPRAVDRVARPPGGPPAARGGEGSQDGHRRGSRQEGPEGDAVMDTVLRKSGTVLAVLAVMLLMVACQSTTGRTLGENIDDTGITAAVKAKLATEKISTLTRIDVDTNQGVVALNGTVQTEAMKARAEQITRQVKGVRDVINNLRIQAAAR